jgi:hypothetical protein
MTLVEMIVLGGIVASFVAFGATLLAVSLYVTFGESRVADRRRSSETHKSPRADKRPAVILAGARAR